MLKLALAMFLIGGVAAWGQTPKDAPGSAEKVDRATAYYHFMLAHMYAEMAVTSRGGNSEYADKAIENYKAALKADPQAPDPKALRSYYPIYVPRPPASGARP